MVTRVPVVTRERLLMFLAIGSCLMALMLKISRCLLPRAVTLRVQEMGQQQRQEPWPLFGHPLSPPRWRIRSTPFAGHGRHGRDFDRGARRQLRADHSRRALRFSAHRIFGPRQEPRQLGVSRHGRGRGNK